MGKQSILVLGDTGIEQNVTSDKVRADGWFGQKDGLHTILWQLEDFTGRIFLEASLETEPEEKDWFPIQLDGAKSFIEYPLNSLDPSGPHGDTFVDAFTFQLNALWIRVRINRSFVVPVPTTDAEKGLLGSIGKVLLNH